MNNSAAVPKGDRLRRPPALVFWVVGSAALVMFFVPPAVPARGAALDALALLVPAGALFACLLAVRAVPAARVAPWVVFAAAAAFSLAGQLVTRAPVDADAWTIFLQVGAMGLLAVGIGWLLNLRERERFLEIALDAALIVAAVTVVTLRWSPAAHDLLAGPSATVAEQLRILGAPIATGAAFLLASVLGMVWAGRGSGIAVALFAACAAFGLAAAPFALGRGSCCTAADVATLPFLLGWLGVAYAGVYAAAEPALAGAPRRAPHDGGSRIRMVVAPAVAVVMGAVVVDTVWRGPLQQATAAAFGMLGVLLAGRVSQLLFATRTQSAERRELAQSRAMIEVSQALSGTLRLDETLDLVTLWAVRLMDAHAATIELLTPDGVNLEVHAVHGIHPPPLHMQFPVRGSFTGSVVEQGRARSGDSHTDAYSRPSSVDAFRAAPVAAAPLRYRQQTLGALSCVGRHPFTESDLELLGALADQAAVAIQNARLFEQVHQLSMTDPLTGLANRRQLERDLAREFAAARRGRSLVAVMFDLNGFKAYNDRHGHLAGDQALKRFAQALATETRAMNMAARYGGDEFIALLADNDSAGTRVFIERVRARFPGPEADEAQQGLTVSAGFATFDPAMQWPEELIEAADRSLYEQKTGLRASETQMR